VYYGSEFFVPKDEMEKVKDLVDTVLGKSRSEEVDIKCGVANWNAARDQVSSGRCKAHTHTLLAAAAVLRWLQLCH
jgi:hypothetical protein